MVRACISTAHALRGGGIYHTQYVCVYIGCIRCRGGGKGAGCLHQQELHA